MMCKPRAGGGAWHGKLGSRRGLPECYIFSGPLFSAREILDFKVKLTVEFSNCIYKLRYVELSLIIINTFTTAP